MAMANIKFQRCFERRKRGFPANMKQHFVPGKWTRQKRNMYQMYGFWFVEWKALGDQREGDNLGRWGRAVETLVTEQADFEMLFKIQEPVECKQRSAPIFSQ